MSLTVSDEGHSYVISKLYKDPNFPSIYKGFLLDTIEVEEFILNVLHRIYLDKRFQGKRLFEIGCGPTVHRIAPASRVFSEIIQCEFSEHNREIVQKWLKNDPTAQDWGRLIRITARQEEYGDLDQGIREIENRIRGKVKKIVPCDVLQKKVIQEDIGKCDVLFTSYCLEGACPTPEAYKSAVNKLGKYVVPGGGLIMVVILDMPYFCMKSPEKKYKWDVLPVSQKLVNEALKEAGFTKKHWYLMENNEESEGGEFSGVVVVSALKN
ncbi:nicotinamide N-methyltransferase-like [Centruroides vittatus]|uniref:nicotinamide N-methyltransferase-like n=1 Tax=Centruroides vittatus TaxID=120091 RepID=UPI003510AFCB